MKGLPGSNILLANEKAHTIMTGDALVRLADDHWCSYDTRRRRCGEVKVGEALHLPWWDANISTKGTISTNQQLSDSGEAYLNFQVHLPSFQLLPIQLCHLV